MMNISSQSALRASVAALSILVPTTSLAQTQADELANNGSDNSGEIIVTATRKAESISKVPLSISAYSTDTLERRGVRNFADLIRQTPGVVTEATNTTTNISIRGVNSPVGAATTGIYIDDTPIQIRSLGYGGGNTYPVIYDLERVEVLRGPQGTLFGASSMGGTIRFISPQPDLNNFSGSARAEIAGTEKGGASYEIGAAVGGPLVAEKLGFRVTGYYRRDGGFIDRVRFEDRSVVKDNANYSNSYVGRAALTWKPIENLEITPSIFYQNVYNNDTPTAWDNIQADPSQPNAPFSDYDDGIILTGNRVQEKGRDKFVLPAINIEYALGGIDLIAIGSYFDRTENFDRDYTTFDQSLFTGITLPIFPDQAATSFFRNSQKNYTAEIRLQSTDKDSRFSWVVGGFYTSAEQVAVQQVEDVRFFDYAPFLIPFFPPLVDGRLIYDQKTIAKDKQAAVFGQVNFKPVDKLTLTVGMRYGETRFNIDGFAQGPVVGPPVVDNGKQKESPFTPKFGVDFQIDDDNLLYASASKGFRPGGYNPQVGVGCQASDLDVLGYPNGRPTLYKSDSVWSYEVGVKSKLAGGRFGIQASAYQIDWSNIQQQVALNGCGFQFTANLGQARSRGFDVQLDLRLTESFSFQAEIGYTTATFRETVFGGPTSTLPLVSRGDNILTPPWTVSLHAQYDASLFSERDAYFRADFDYRAKQKSVIAALNPANGSIDPTLTNPPAITQLSLRAGYRFGEADISVFVNNLLNEHDWAGRRSRDNLLSTIYRSNIVRPRTFGLTASYRF